MGREPVFDPEPLGAGAVMSLATEPRPKRWSKPEYRSLLEWLGQDKLRYELLDGAIIQMPPQTDSHALALSLADYALRRVFGEGFVVRVQSPLDISAASEPEPDLMVLRGAPRDILKHPRTAELIVEVVVTSLNYDRDVKGSLYASHGIADYWLVNVPERRLEVRRQPMPDPGATFRHSYSQVLLLTEGEDVRPLALPGAQAPVTDLLP